MLAFLPVRDVIDGFVELTDDDDLPQELVSYSETHYTGGERGLEGLEGAELSPLFPHKPGRMINGQGTLWQELTTV